MKCKKVLGMKICKLNSAEVVRLPVKVDNKIPVSIYTSKNCRLCKSLVSKQLKSLNPIKDLVRTQIVDVEQSHQINPNVLSIPTMQVGKNILGSNPSDMQIIKSLRNHFNTNKVI